MGMLQSCAMEFRTSSVLLCLLQLCSSSRMSPEYGALLSGDMLLNFTYSSPTGPLSNITWYNAGRDGTDDVRILHYDARNETLTYYSPYNETKANLVMNDSSVALIIYEVVNDDISVYEVEVVHDIVYKETYDVGYLVTPHEVAEIRLETCEETFSEKQEYYIHGSCSNYTLFMPAGFDHPFTVTFKLDDVVQDIQTETDCVTDPCVLYFVSEIQSCDNAKCSGATFDVDLMLLSVPRTTHLLIFYVHVNVITTPATGSSGFFVVILTSVCGLTTGLVIAGIVMLRIRQRNSELGDELILQNRSMASFHRGKQEEIILHIPSMTSFHGGPECRTRKSQLMTTSGGVIELFGVKLDIPPDSLSVATDIELSIIFRDSHQPRLSDAEAILCPVVSCGPHGLQLRKLATLTMPHSAISVKTNWIVRVLTSETSWNEYPQWKEHGTYEVNEQRIKIDIEHFTLFTGVGQAGSNDVPAQKMVDLIAFSPSLTGELFQVRIYCVNKYDNKEMTTCEKDQSGVRMSSPTKLVFHNNGKDLEMKIDKILRRWRISEACSITQCIPFEAVWHSGCGSCKFVLVSEDVNSTMVTCCVIGHQLGQCNNSATLVIAAEKVKRNASMMCDLTLLDPVFPEDLRNILMKQLDPDMAAASNWQHLAEAMGKTMWDVVWLSDERKNTGRSPTISLLQDWIKEGKTLKQLEETMQTICRFDVERTIRDWRVKNMLTKIQTTQLLTVKNYTNKPYNSI